MPIQGNRIYLPIGSFLRSDHYDVKVKTSSGEELPFLPRSRERRLVAAGLALESMEGMQFGKTIERKKELDFRFQEVLRLLESDPPSDPEDDSLPPGYPDFLIGLSGVKEFRRNYLIIATPLLNEAFGHGNGWDLYPGLLRLIETHAEALLPGRNRNEFDVRAEDETLRVPGRRLYWSASGSKPTEVSADCAFWRLPRRSEDIAFGIPANPAMCQSLHVHIACPPGIYIDGSALTVLAGSNLTKTGAESTEKVFQVADDDVHWDSSHLFFSRNILGDDVVAKCQALVVLRPRYHGFMRPGMYLAIMAVVIMFSYTFTLGWKGTGWPGIQGSWLGQSNPDPVTALLLGALTVALGVMIRPDEHEMTRSVATVYRGQMFAITVSVLAAAVTISVGFQGVALFVVLLSASIVALFFLIPLVRSADYSRRRGQEKPPPRSPDL